MTGDELAALRTLIREEMTSGEQRTRMFVREEVNTAVYASEQRMRMFVGDEITASEQRMRTFVGDEITASEHRLNQRIDGVEERLNQRMDGFDRRLDGFERHMDGFGQRLDGIEERLHRTEMLQTQMATNLAKMGTVLEEATIKINELQMSFIALDQKVEGVKRDLQTLTRKFEAWTVTVTEAIAGVSHRLDAHIETPIHRAHPPAAA